MTDSPESVMTAILSKYLRLCAEHEKAQEHVETVQAHQRGLATQINDCFAAARLFGFDLLTAFRQATGDDPRQPPLLPLESPTPGPVAVVSVKNGPTIKTLVLEAAQAAYPGSIRASSLRKELAERGHAIHEKTVGMTLYRLSERELVRREGKEDWYFIPADQRKTRNGHRYDGERESEIALAL